MGAGDDELRFLIDLDANTKGPVEAAGELGRLESVLNKIDGKLGDTGAASEKAAHGHAKHAHEAKGLHGVLDRLTHAAMEPFLHKLKEVTEFEFIRRFADALIEAPGELIEKIRELGEEMLVTAAKTERTEASFKLLFGNDEGAKTVEYFDQIAKFTEFTDDNLKSAAQQLGKVGFAGDALVRASAAALDIAAFSPNPEAGQSEALGSLERIKRTGRVDTRTLGGLGIGNDAFFAELARRTGKSTAVLKKEMEKGKIAAEDSLEALYSVITQKTGRALGGAGVALSTGMQAQLTHLKDLPEQYFEKIAKTEAFTKLKTAFGSILEQLDPDKEPGKHIFAALETVLNGLAEFLGEADVADAIAAVINVMKEGIEDLLALLTIIPGSVGNAAQKAVDKMEHAKRQQEAADYYQLHLAASPKKGTKAYEEQEAKYDAQYRKSAAEDPEFSYDAGTEIGKGMEKGTKDALGIHSPSTVYADIASDTADGYIIGVQRNAARIEDAISRSFGVTPAAGAARGASRQPTHVEVHLSVHVDGSRSDSTDELAKQIATAARGEFADAMDQASNQSGAA